jgi:hypothetical protein
MTVVNRPRVAQVAAPRAQAVSTEPTPKKPAPAQTTAAQGWGPKGAKASPLSVRMPQNVNQYDATTAKGAAAMAKLVYGPQEEVVARLKQAGYTNVEFISAGPRGTEVVVASRKDATVVAFRGTEVDNTAKHRLGKLNVLIDIATDLRGGSGLSTVERFGGKMHTGFMEAYSGVDNRLQEALKRHQGGDKNKPVLFTGHSLGGALAQIAATDAKEKGINVASVYTFGQPRIGDRAFSAHYKQLGLSSKTYRHVNQGDPVPRLPEIKLQNLVGNLINKAMGKEGDRFRHGGNMVYFDDKKTRMLNPDNTKLNELTDRNVLSRQGVGNAGRHSMDEYLQIVSAAE